MKNGTGYTFEGFLKSKALLAKVLPCISQHLKGGDRETIYIEEEEEENG